MSASKLTALLMDLVSASSDPHRSGVSIANHMEAVERLFEAETKAPLEGGRQAVLALNAFHAERDARVLALLKRLELEPLTHESRDELAALLRELEG